MILITNDIETLTKKLEKEVQTRDDTNVLGEHIRKRVVVQME